MRPTTLALVAGTLAVLQRMPPKQTPEDEPPPEKKGPPNTYGLPTGAPLREKLAEFFRKQAKQVLGTLPTVGTELPAHLPPLTDWDDPMAAAMTPILSAYWDEAGKAQRERLGLDPDEWRVTDPHTRETIRQSAMAFCRSTNETTSSELGTALRRLREELTQGIVEQGETLDQLTDRVRQVFDRADEWRARAIAATEASRAVHAAELMSAAQSGVVVGLEWLVSEDACPLCRKVAAEAPRVRLGQAFAVVGHHPDYATVRFPPLHTRCQCSVLEILSPEYGGPEDVQWSQTLDQPKAGDDYEPPGGREPEPRPGARSARPAARRNDPIRGIPREGRRCRR